MGHFFERWQAEGCAGFVQTCEHAILKMENLRPFDKIIRLGTEVVVAEGRIRANKPEANSEPGREWQQRLWPPQVARMAILGNHALHGIADQHEDQIELAGKQQAPQQRTMEVLQRYGLGQPSATKLVSEAMTIAVQGHVAKLRKNPFDRGSASFRNVNEKNAFSVDRKYRH